MNLQAKLVETAKSWAAAKLKASELEIELKNLIERVAEAETEGAHNHVIGELRHRIREVRELRGMSQRELGEKLGFKNGQALISAIENGWREPAPSLLAQIEKALGTSFAVGDVDGSRTRTLSPLELQVLNAIAAYNGKPLSIALVADHVKCRTAEVSEPLEALVDDGLLAKTTGGFVLAEHANKGAA